LFVDNLSSFFGDLIEDLFDDNLIYFLGDLFGDLFGELYFGL